MARRYSSQESKRRILSACVKLFIEKGYHRTTLAEILSEANVTNSTFQNIFRAKDGVLLELTEFMFENQFVAARSMNKDAMKPVFVYAVETAIQLTISELNENIRDVYVEAYSNEETLEYILNHTANENYKIFSSYNPTLDESDFYELEIGTAGIMHNYMAKRCDKYFTLERKLKRFLSMSMRVYNVPDEEIVEVIEFVFSMDIRSIANQIIQNLFKSLAMHFEFELGKDSEWRSGF